MNNTSEYVTDKDDNCVSCGKVVTEADNGAECSRWEHSVSACAGLNATEYNMISGSSPKIMFFCTKCQLKVNMTLRFFNDVREKQRKFETRLKLVEHKLEVVEENVEVKIDVSYCALEVRVDEKLAELTSIDHQAN